MGRDPLGSDGAVQIKSIRIKGLNWSPQQAAGAPDTRTQGDQVTAWASRTSDGGTEWLELEYAKPVLAREIDIYESYNPGALFRVTIFDAKGNEIEAWSGSDPTPPGSANNASTVPISKVRISSNIPTKTVRLYLAADKVPGWNEVDAVALISDAGELQWGAPCTRSSTYASASGISGGGNPGQLVPPWSGLDRPSALWELGVANREERLIDARGWPLLALMSETDSLASPVNANGNMPPRATVYSKSLGGLPSSRSGDLHPFTVSHAHSFADSPDLVRADRRHSDLFDRVANSLDDLDGSTAVHHRGGTLPPWRCIQCGYDLGFDFIHGCSECGWRRDRVDQFHARMHLIGKSNRD